MSWGDNLNINTNADNINLNNRCKYVRGLCGDLNYMLSHVKTKRVGQVFVGICPFPTHFEKTASFTIYPPGYKNKDNVQDYASFYCYGCGEGGDVIKFRQLLEGLESKEDACKKFEEELGIDINDNDVRQSLLKETLDSVKNSHMQTFDFVTINRICSGICKEYLSWVRSNYPKIIKQEFDIIQKFYKYFDEQILEMNMIEAKQLISQTENIILERRLQISNN